MEEKLLEQSRQYKVKHKKKKKFKKVFNILACVVVFCVTYALILPAITMEKKSYCGYEEHKHSDECYEKQLICGQEEGETVEAHTHESQCYSYEDELVCQIEETEGHIHSDACKETNQLMICGIEESEEHAHSDVCYEVSENIVCGIEEAQGHAHSESCYETKETLICTVEEVEESVEGHKHSDSCYDSKMTCEKEEHEHELICFSDKNADVENSSDWEATLPKELTGVWADDVLAIAKSQLGYEESAKNYIVTEDGKTQGYTRYGDWYGDSYGHWCAMYVSFCLHYAGVDTELIPLDANCQNWIETLSEEKYELYYESGTYIPVPGDLIFFDWDDDERSEHIGLVVEYIEATDNETAKIKTIEGNASDIVQYKTYEANDPEIMGFGKLPENPELEDVPVEEIEGVERQAIKAEIYTDETMSEEAKEDRTIITVEGYLPEGITAKAYPVQLEEDMIEGRRIILAYDITLYDEEGNVFDAETEGVTLTVTIEPADWTYEDEKIESKDCTIYYIPEEGEPELMETDSEKDAVTFQTEHFSTYALTVGGTMDAVYLNGASGNDSAAGGKNTPVKTLARAFELVENGGTIYITGTVTLNEDTELDLNDGENVTIKRESSFTGVLISVANGTNLKLGNIRIHGGTSGPSTGSIESTISYAIIKNNTYAKAPLIVVQSGGSLVITDGAVLEYNSNKPDSVSTSGYLGQGGAVYCQGNLTMTGGTIQYCEALSGGGIYIQSSGSNRIVFNLSGGTIQYNYAREIKGTSNGARKNPYHSNAGGGVYVGDYVTMNMSGGLISGNQSAREGGGISLGWLDRNNGSAINSFITTFNMTGGTFTGNIATSTGGGLNITAGREAYIYAGTFTDNTANGTEYQPKDSSNSWTVYSGGAIYVDAKQYDSKGGYAGKPGYAMIHRVLLTENSAGYYGGAIATCSTSSGTVNASVELDGTLIYNNTASKGGNEMYLEGSTTLEGNYMLGGGTYKWTKSGSYYDNSLTANSSEVIAGKPLATVFITGNHAGVDGGGIGCNGEIEIGGTPNTVSVSITKVWDDEGAYEHPEYITVQLYRDNKVYGDPIKIYKEIDSDGKETWPTYFIDGLPEGKYTIKEITVPGYESVITTNGNDFVITNKRPVTSISVEKQWADGVVGADSVTVQLLKNNENYGEPVVLSAQNGWFHKWDKLPQQDNDGNDITYTVKELPVAGYTGNVTVGEKNGKTSGWIAADKFESGVQYLLVTSDGPLTVSGTSGLKWGSSVTDLIKNGTQADSSLLWTASSIGNSGSSARLQNGSGKYLYLSGNQTKKFSASNSYTTIYYDANGRLYATSSRSNYYFTGISDTSGSTSTDSSKGKTFTLYKWGEKSIDYGETHYVVTNTKKKGSISVDFVKYSVGSDKDMILAGAKLELYKEGEGDAQIPGTSVIGTLIGSWTSESAVSETKGIHTLELESGTYYLVERDVPEGHQGLAGPIIFTVNAENGYVTIVDYPGYENVSVTVNGDGKGELPVYNKALFELPETGGMGTNFFYIIGSILMIGAAVLLVTKRRMRN